MLVTIFVVIAICLIIIWYATHAVVSFIKLRNITHNITKTALDCGWEQCDGLHFCGQKAIKSFCNSDGTISMWFGEMGNGNYVIFIGDLIHATKGNESMFVSVIDNINNIPTPSEAKYLYEYYKKEKGK